MTLSDIAIRRPITTVMFFSAIVLLGIVSVYRLPVLLIPEIAPPYGGAYCWTRQNMSVEELERKIIRPIEGEIAQLPDVKTIRVWSGGRGAFFPIEFEFGTNVKYRIVELQERLDAFRRTFPRNSIRCNAFPFDTSHENKELMDLVLKGPRSDPYLTQVYTEAERIRQRLEDIDGVAAADIWGGKERSVDVSVLQDRLSEFRIPFWQVINTVQTFANEPVFLGDIEEGGTKYYVRLDGQFDNTDEIEDVVIKKDGNIAVRHLGEVEDQYHSRRYLRRVDGQPAVGMDLEKEALVNPIELSGRVRKVIASINEELPEGYQLDIRWDQAEFIREILKTLSKLALMGIFLSMLILYLFIRNIQMTLIVSLVIPICVIATFNCMYFSNMTINMLTLLGLAIGVGILIDTSIVVLENIFRHHERGKEAIQSSLIGSREVGTAVFALTLTNVVVFLPIIFIEGEIALIFTEGALAIIYPMLISMVVALSLVPMATSRVLLFVDRARELKSRGFAQRFSFLSSVRSVYEKFKNQLKRIPHPTMAILHRWYWKILKNCLRHRIRFLIAIILVVLYTYFYTMSGINRDVLETPEDDQWFSVHIYLPQGTKQDYTLQVVSEVEDMLLEQVPEKKHIHSWVQDDYARILIQLKDKDERERESPTIQEELRPYMEQFGQAEVTFNYTRTRGEDQAPPVDTGQSGVIEIRGPEYEKINSISDQFIPILNQIPGIRDVESETEAGPLEFHFKLDREKAALLQVTPQLIAQSIQVAQRRGDYATIQMKKGDDEIDIYFSQLENPEDLKKDEDEQEGLKKEELRQVPIYCPALNSTVTLENLGTFEVRRGMGQIQRENRERIGRIRFETASTANYQEIEEAVQTLVDAYPLTAGYRMELGGRSRRLREDMQAGYNLVYLALTLIYMCIASLFESFILPFVIMLAIPFAIIGIVWIFILTGTPFTELAILGGVFLIGMLPNSSILLIHFAGYLRREKAYPRVRAVMMSGHTRLRPILMTVLTTILGLLPMAFGDEEWVPFSICVIGGLASSTVLTLIIVPGFYFIIEDLGALGSRIIRYITSWRWLFLFWSKKRRLSWKKDLTAYRRKPAREELLRVEIDHLVRIYPPSRLESLGRKIRQFPAATRVMAPVPGIVPVSAKSTYETVSTRARNKALDGVCLTIEPGLFGLLGPNGAGKTTLLRLIAGIDQPTRGYLSICGYDMKTEDKKAKKLIGYLPQNFEVYSGMTAFQYLDYFALLKGVKRKNERKEAVLKALEMVNLLDQRRVPVGNFSGGMKRRIGLGQIFVNPPKVLIVDEPTAGLDPHERVRFRNLLAQLSQDRVVILSTHIVEDVAHSCRNLALMNEGKILFTGTPGALTVTVEGKVWETTVSDESTWHEYRRRFQVAGQSHTADGIRLRIVSDSAPDSRSQTVEPSLEDAYLYHTRVFS